MSQENLKDTARIKLQLELKKSEHPLADGILCLTHDVANLTETVKKIHKVIAGDEEYQIEGLIQKNEKSKIAHKATEEDLKKMDARISGVETIVKKEVFRMKTIGACIVLAWAIVGDYLKSILFGTKH